MNNCPTEKRQTQYVSVNVFLPCPKHFLFCRYEVAPRSDSEDSGSEEEEEEEVHKTLIPMSKQNGHQLFSDLTPLLLYFSLLGG